MAHPINQPFPQTADPPLVLKPGAEAMKDYLAVFESRRSERPGGTFADADISEIMRMAENRGKVSGIEMRYIHKHLIRDRAAFFSNEAQKTRLRILVRNHEERNTAAKADEFVDSVLELAPIEYFRRSDAVAFILTAQSLSAALSASRSHYAEHGSDDPTLVEAVNDLSTELAKQIKGLTLSDVDKVGRPGRRARRRNAANFVRRMDGKVDHEAKWDPDTKTWQNWNRDISLFPVDRKLPKTRQAVAALIRNHDPIRLVAGGHAFNTSSDTGGKKGSRVGILITLDDYKLSGRDAWKRIDKATASSR